MIVTFIASTLVFVICLVTAEEDDTVTPTAVVDSLLTIPGIDVWFAVPNLGVKPTL